MRISHFTTLNPLFIFLPVYLRPTYTKPTDSPEGRLPTPKDLPKTENKVVQLQPSIHFTIFNPLVIYLPIYLPKSSVKPTDFAFWLLPKLRDLPQTENNSVQLPPFHHPQPTVYLSLFTYVQRLLKPTDLPEWLLLKHKVLSKRENKVIQLLSRAY